MTAFMTAFKAQSKTLAAVAVCAALTACLPGAERTDIPEVFTVEASISADRGGNSLLPAGKTVTVTGTCGHFNVGHRFCGIKFPDLGLSIDLSRPPVANGNLSILDHRNPDWAYSFEGHGLDPIPDFPTKPMFTFGRLEKGVAFSMHRKPHPVYNLDPAYAKELKLPKYSDLEERDPERYAGVVERYKETKVMLTVRLKAAEVAAK